MLRGEIRAVAAVSRREKHALHVRHLIVEREPALPAEHERAFAGLVAGAVADIDQRPFSGERAIGDGVAVRLAEPGHVQRPRGLDELALARGTRGTPDVA